MAFSLDEDCHLQLRPLGGLGLVLWGSPSLGLRDGGRRVHPQVSQGTSVRLLGCQPAVCFLALLPPHCPLAALPTVLLTCPGKCLDTHCQAASGPGLCLGFPCHEWDRQAAGDGLG